MDDRLYASIPIGVLDGPVAYHRIFRDVAGSTVGAVFLSQAWYWTKKLPEERDGWFYKTIEEWEEETGLSRREQARARTELKSANILEEERRGIDPTVWFRIDIDQLATAIRKAWNQKARTSPDVQTVHQVMSEPHISRWANRTSLHITETTAQTTAETLDAQKIPQKSGKPFPIPSGWLPDTPTINVLVEEGFDTTTIGREIVKFRDHFISNGGKKVRWDLAFRNWMRNGRDRFGTIRPSNGTGQPLRDRNGNYTTAGLVQRAKELEEQGL